MPNLKEIFEIVKSKCNLSVGLVHYIYKDERGIIQLGNYIIVDFKEEEKSLKTMEEVSKKSGFMFFVESEEGQKWIKENIKIIQQIATNYILGKAGYGIKICKN